MQGEPLACPPLSARYLCKYFGGIISIFYPCLQHILGLHLLGLSPRPVCQRIRARCNSTPYDVHTRTKKTQSIVPAGMHAKHFYNRMQLHTSCLDIDTGGQPSHTHCCGHGQVQVGHGVCPRSQRPSHPLEWNGMGSARRTARGPAAGPMLGNILA